MRIESINLEPLAYVDSFTAGRGGRKVEHRRLPILHGTISGLPEGLAGIVATSDLQGYHSKWVPPEHRRLTGFCMVSALLELAASSTIPSLKNMAAFLPGDFYAIAEMDRRGGMGDVQDVWLAFAKEFRWIAGVAGNHDSFLGAGNFDGVFNHWPDVHALDAEARLVDGIAIGGISGIVGNDRKFWHYSMADMEQRLRSVLKESPDLLVMHDGPAHPTVTRRMGCWYTDLMKDFEGLVIRGHRHWPEPVLDIGSFQVLNVDSRAVVLEAV